jgi:hypothetical protein
MLGHGVGLFCCGCDNCGCFACSLEQYITRDKRCVISK